MGRMLSPGLSDRSTPPSRAGSLNPLKPWKSNSPLKPAEPENARPLQKTSSTAASLRRRPPPGPPRLGSPPSSASSFTGGSGGGDEWGASSFPSGGGGGDEWGSTSSTGLTKDHFDGSLPSVGYPVPSPPAPVSRELAAVRAMDEEDKMIRDLERDNRESKAYVDSWGNRMRETCALLKQVREPGARGSYLKDSEKQEMYRLHKEDPATYTVERRAKDFRVMRQRVHAILWLKEMEEEEERKRG